MQRLTLSHFGIDHSQLRAIENPRYDFIFRPFEPPHGYKGGPGDIED